jgi:hypothetical protein
MCPMNNRNGWAPFQQAIIEAAADEENIVVFGGNIETFTRKRCQELKQIVADGNQRSTERKAAQEKLERWADQGSKFAAEALSELGIGSHVMTPAQFDKAVTRLRLDPKTDRKVRAMGPKLFKFAAELGVAPDRVTQLDLQDFVQRCGRKTAGEFLSHVNDAEIEGINLEFVSLNPDYYKSDGNRGLLVDYLGEKYLGYPSKNEDDEERIMSELLYAGHWSVEELTAAWKALKNSGETELKPGTARSLSTDDKSALSLAAAAIFDAAALDRFLTHYVQVVLDDDTLAWQECARNSAYVNVMFDAVFFVFEHKNATYRPSSGAKEYIKDFLAGRFPTLDLLNAAWEECKRETGGRGLISQATGIAEEVETSRDEELDELNERHTVRR